MVEHFDLEHAEVVGKQFDLDHSDRLATVEHFGFAFGHFGSVEHFGDHHLALGHFDFDFAHLEAEHSVVVVRRLGAAVVVHVGREGLDLAAAARVVELVGHQTELEIVGGLEIVERLGLVVGLVAELVEHAELVGLVVGHQAGLEIVVGLELVE